MPPAYDTPTGHTVLHLPHQRSGVCRANRPHRTALTSSEIWSVPGVQLRSMRRQRSGTDPGSPASSNRPRSHEAKLRMAPVATASAYHHERKFRWLLWYGRVRMDVKDKLLIISYKLGHQCIHTPLLRWPLFPFESAPALSRALM